MRLGRFTACTRPYPHPYRKKLARASNDGKGYDRCPLRVKDEAAELTSKVKIFGLKEI
ncbi:hypothetical protein AVDCRST_MAG94-3327 [uncultured Leptolyngbya sp.]|uniref:Uncharacterized protein n=1 Tax=uncultured Leptolyngbya sp. TaxID=332963 RepID=A0A6J4MJY6_9CYAN|nr:hypothetical protein AVDCRST_MAG94-3327 [uncultured Leptolyngbya sp.]